MKIKTGFLPLYLKLYDDAAPGMRTGIEEFYSILTAELEKRDLEVITTGICRLEEEFKQAIRNFKESGVEVIITTHMAYSPSLEAIEAFLATDLPIVIMDTTPDFDFSPEQTADRISFNHGIHGVQDLCSLFVRNRRQFFIEAGHWKNSDLIDRIENRVRGAAAAEALKHANIGLIGGPFKGMGDFYVEPEILKRSTGIKTIPFNKNIPPYEISEEELDEQLLSIREYMEIEDMPSDVLRENIRLTCGLQRWMKEENLNGFSCNFLEINGDGPVNRVPFLMSAAGMYSGLGYAGEGDVLTAALVYALMKINPYTSFTEMFCPDWKNNRIFLSHMGEINPRTCKDKAVIRMKEFKYGTSKQPVSVTGQFMEGNAHIVNAVPMGNGTFRLVICPVTVESHNTDNFSKVVHGWIKPEIPVSRFLEEYSKAGGTHHSALIYHESIETIKTFGLTLGWDIKVIN